MCDHIHMCEPIHLCVQVLGKPRVSSIEVDTLRLGVPGAAHTHNMYTHI